MTARDPSTAPAQAPAAVPPADPLDDFFYREGEEAPDVPDVGAGLRRAPAAAPAGKREYIAFRLGSEDYAFEIERVREVLKAPIITEVPRCPTHVAGVILVRGEVVTVQDPRHRLGIPGAPGASARVIVCDVAGERVGLLVDAVSQVLRLPASAIEAPTQGIASIDDEYIAGVGREEGRIYILLDVEALIAAAPAGGPA